MPKLRTGAALAPTTAGLLAQSSASSELDL